MKTKSAQLSATDKSTHIQPKGIALRPSPAPSRLRPLPLAPREDELEGAGADAGEAADPGAREQEQVAAKLVLAGPRVDGEEL